MLGMARKSVNKQVSAKIKLCDDDYDAENEFSLDDFMEDADSRL